MLLGAPVGTELLPRAPTGTAGPAQPPVHEERRYTLNSMDTVAQASLDLVSKGVPAPIPRVIDPLALRWMKLAFTLLATSANGSCALHPQLCAPSRDARHPRSLDISVLGKTANT